MLETITAVNQAVNSFIWGIPAMVCIIGVGLLLSVRTGFLQIRKFPYAIRTTIGRIFRRKDASDGAMTPFQAVCTALAATVGTGNIAGVAGAIAIGGPGAVFWMWCSALLGMCTKFSEVTLAVHFRERNKNGELVGGPMYYIKNGLGSRWQFLAVLYSLFGVLTVFGTGNATQVNTIVTAIDSALLAYGINPACAGYLLCSHLSSDLSHRKMLEVLGLKPIVDAGMRLGEGTGANVAMSILRTALNTYRTLTQA